VSEIGFDLVRDENGVPHVQASDDVGLYRGLGYCHAFDRGLQMVLARVLFQGRGSEIIGSSDDMLRSDRFFRRLNLCAGAAEEVEKLSDTERAAALAYCEGASLALRERPPWELRLFGHRPLPWTMADAVALSRAVGYVSLAQSQGDMERLLIEMVQAGVPRRHLEELFPDALGAADLDLLRGVQLGERVVPDSVRWRAAVPRAMASNNWVLSGRKTASGLPLLANDPHLEVNRLPAVWYEVVLECGERFCTAATMPGLPGLLLGRTNDLAWGATYSFMDATDSWIEDCRDGAYRRTIDGAEQWLPFRPRTEVIRRRKKPDVLVTFHENEHGVLDGDPSRPGLYLATRWAVAAGTGAASLAGVLGILHAETVEAGMECLGRVETAWNWVLADRHGGIGYQMSGLLPRRRPGASGLVPLPGWDPANDWQGFVPAAELPRALNPEEGFLVTANDDLNHLGVARPINLPMGSHRADRIAAVLAGRDGWTVDDTERLQMDVYSTQAARFMDVLRPLLPVNHEGQLLHDWDCRYDLDSQGAALFEAVYRELVTDVFGRACGADVLRFLQSETGILAGFYNNFDRVLLADDSVWFAGETRDAVLGRVAQRVLAAPAKAWGAQQQVVMKHLLLGDRFPSWMGFDHGPIALRGGRATIHQGQIFRSGGRVTSFAPSFRLVTDFAEDASHTALAGGPSDRRFSPWYTSGVEDWLDGRFKTLRPARRGD
jgi:penicillin amidase